MAWYDIFNNIGNSGMNVFGASTPTYLKGLVADDKLQTLERNSLIKGLLGTALGYIAQPKNRGYGSFAPYLAQSYLNVGVPFADQTMSNFEKDTLKKYQFDELKRKEKERENQLKFLQNFGKPNVTKTVTENVPVGTSITGLEENSIGPNFATKPVTTTSTEYDPYKEIISGINAGVIKPEFLYQYGLDKQKMDLDQRRIDADIEKNKLTAPTVKEFIQGNKKITKQWSPSLGWVTVAEGEAFAPKTVKLHNDKVEEAKDGTLVYLPTPEGIKSGVKPIKLTGETYDKPFVPKPKSLTESQSQALTFGKRMEISNDAFTNLVDENGKVLYNPMLVGSKRVIENWWIVGDAISAGINTYLLDANDQLAAQSMRDFINAALRRESGAAIAAHEFTNAQAQYFPEVGDTPEVIKQKEENRKIAIATMQAAAAQDPEAIEKLEVIANEIKSQEPKVKKENNNQNNNNKKPRKATLDNRVIVEDLINNRWIFEDTGEPVSAKGQR